MNPTTNLFVVDTSLQLLNAIEAAKHFNLSHNHLVVVNEAGQRSSAYRRIIDDKDWDKVTYIWLVIDTDGWIVDLLGRRFNGVVRAWYGRYLHFRRMRRAAKLVRSVGPVDILFLGHYWAEKKGFMRHFANTIKYKNLVIIDDGTDVIEINNQRTTPSQAHSDAGRHPWHEGFLRRLTGHLRARYWQWDIRDAPTVTFFTSYDLQVEARDQLVKNDYRYLRSLAGAGRLTDMTLFLGQCLAEDGYMDARAYLSYLRRVKEYFDGQHVQYVPHPRESPQTIEMVRESIGFEIKRYDLPVEYELVTSADRPRGIASFFCSALESCSKIFGDGLEVTCFYIAPEHLKTAHRAVAMFYDYFERRTDANFSVIRLSIDGLMEAEACPG